MAEITPKTNTKLFGQDDAEAALMRDLKANHLAHGWIISGPPGIGKATLAYRFARTLLSGYEPDDITEDDPVFRRVAAASHVDLLVVEPLLDPKKDERARNISVEQAREIPQFLSLTPGEGRWRVVIVDPADALNANAANAILKILEEPPPQAVLLLVSHNPGKLLPTIRSRCRTLKLKPLAREQFIRAMRHVAPATDGGQLQQLAEISLNSPGIAIDLLEHNAIEMYERMLAVLAPFPAINALDVHAFSEQFSGALVHGNWQVFSHLALHLLERVARSSAGYDVASESSEEAVLQRLAGLHPAAVWAAKWQQTANQFMVAERLHLDYKQLVIVFLHSMLKKDFQIGDAAA